MTESRGCEKTSGWHDVTTNAVDERYFSTMGIRLVSGRSFRCRGG